jgi:hypothetical protein
MKESTIQALSALITGTVLWFGSAFAVGLWLGLVAGWARMIYRGML